MLARRSEQKRFRHQTSFNCLGLASSGSGLTGRHSSSRQGQKGKSYRMGTCTTLELVSRLSQPDNLVGVVRPEGLKREMRDASDAHVEASVPLNIALDGGLVAEP